MSSSVPITHQVIGRLRDNEIDRVVLAMSLVEAVGSGLNRTLNQSQEALAALCIAQEKVAEASQLLGGAAEGTGADVLLAAIASLTQSTENLETASRQMQTAQEHVVAYATEVLGIGHVVRSPSGVDNNTDEHRARSRPPRKHNPTRAPLPFDPHNHILDASHSNNIATIPNNDDALLRWYPHNKNTWPPNANAEYLLRAKQITEEQFALLKACGFNIPNPRFFIGHSPTDPGRPTLYIYVDKVPGEPIDPQNPNHRQALANYYDKVLEYYERNANGSDNYLMDLSPQQCSTNNLTLYDVEPRLRPTRDETGQVSFSLLTRIHKIRVEVSRWPMSPARQRIIERCDAFFHAHDPSQDWGTTQQRTQQRNAADDLNNLI